MSCKEVGRREGVVGKGEALWAISFADFYYECSNAYISCILCPLKCISIINVRHCLFLRWVHLKFKNARLLFEEIKVA